MLQYESIVIPPITPGCMSFSGILLIANIEFPSRTCCYCENLVPLSLTGQGMNTIEVPIMIIIEASVAVKSFVDQSRFLDHPLVPRSLLSIDALLLNPWLFLDHFRSLIDLCFLNQRWASWSLFPIQIHVCIIILINVCQVCTWEIPISHEWAPHQSLLG